MFRLVDSYHSHLLLASSVPEQQSLPSPSADDWPTLRLQDKIKGEILSSNLNSGVDSEVLTPPRNQPIIDSIQLLWSQQLVESKMVLTFMGPIQPKTRNSI